jgi:ubiquitin C-terminal hydrolase
MRGEIAQSFGALLQRIWSDTSQTTSYSPREFKSVLSRFAPQFSGYQQHDTQEFVAFLLDGLHEDLNRVLKKPYVEKPDWNGGGDLELVKLASSSWEGYMKRNDSVIVDLFQGQYRSTLVCPECNKVSASPLTLFDSGAELAGHRCQLPLIHSCTSRYRCPSIRSGVMRSTTSLGTRTRSTSRSLLSSIVTLVSETYAISWAGGWAQIQTT